MTDSTEIKKILNRYFEGETSIDEERMLKKYFNSEGVAEDLKTFAPLFKYFEDERSIILDNAVSQKIKNSAPNLKYQAPHKFFKIISKKIWLRACAVLILVSGATLIFLKNKSSVTNIATPSEHKHKAKIIIYDGSENPEIAFAAIKSAMTLTSSKMKKGTEPMSEGFEKFREVTTIIR